MIQVKQHWIFPAFAGAGSSAMYSPGWTRTGSRGVHGMEPGGGGVAARGRGGHRRQDGAPFPRHPRGQGGSPSGQRLGLGQHFDPGTGEDGGEIQRNHRHTQVATTAGPERLHDTSDANIDAMGCQKDIAQGTLEQGADYVLAVKQNQRRLYEDLKDLFEEGEATGF